MTRMSVVGPGLAVILLVAASPSAPGVDTPASLEEQIGQAAFDELKDDGEVISASPLYDLLAPVVTPITKTAQPRYEFPLKFYLVHQPQPNAFSVPGGNVYVTDEMLYFVRNAEQLAGTLCHEVAHATAHDSMKLIEKQVQRARRQVGVAILLGPSRAQMIAITLLEDLRKSRYSREVESRADLTGAEICAASGWNPWGLVWLLEDFEQAAPGKLPEALSDHPTNAHRLAALKKHFRDNPAVFASFSPDRSRAKPFAAPKDAPVVFLR
jgi:predicted Zn-dependent protease